MLHILIIFRGILFLNLKAVRVKYMLLHLSLFYCKNKLRERARKRHIWITFLKLMPFTSLFSYVMFDFFFYYFF